MEFRRREALTDLPFSRNTEEEIIGRDDTGTHHRNGDRALSLASFLSLSKLTPSNNNDEDYEKRRNSWSAHVQMMVASFWGYNNEDKHVSLIEEDTDDEEDSVAPLGINDDVESISEEAEGYDDDDDDDELSINDDNNIEELQGEASTEMIELECEKNNSCDDDEACFICLGPFTKKDDSEKIGVPCSTCYKSPVHAKCIFEWKERASKTPTCPLCRQELGRVDYSPPDLLKIHTFIMMSARKSFISRPVPPQIGMLRCYLRVQPSNWLGLQSYSFYIQPPSALSYPLGPLPRADGPSEGDQLLLTARKRICISNSRIDISLDRNGEDYKPKSPNYVGYVNATFSGLDHSICTTNENGQTQELGHVNYSQNRFGLSVGPRKMKVCLANAKQDEENIGNEDEEEEEQQQNPLASNYVTIPHIPRKKSESMSTKMNKTHSSNQDCIVFGENRSPSWLESIQAYSLDFHGRVTLPSNKNFQLCLNEPTNGYANPDQQLDGEQPIRDHRKTTLQFGKVVSHESNTVAVYTLDFQYPLSPLQAFGIAISSCDRKLACA